MKDLMTVASFTIKEMIKRKSFIVSTIIILVIIIAGMNVPNIIKMANNGNEEALNTKILVVDAKNIYEGALNNIQVDYNFETTTEDLTVDAIKEKITNKDFESAILVQKEDEKIVLNYIVKSVGLVGIPNSLSTIFSQTYKDIQLSKMNLSTEQLATIQMPFDLQVTQIEETSGNVFVMMMLCLVLFFAIYYCAFQVSSSITTEKTSKIMETLVTSTTPRTIVLGKTLGIGLVGLGQMALFIITALVCMNIFMDSSVISQMFDMTKITPILAILSIVYFVLGYGTYALLYALTGSTVSKPEDVQSANGPVAFLAIIGFYLAYFSMMNPGSGLNVFSAIFPLSSPFSMPFRIMMGLAKPEEIVISLLVLVVTMIIIASVSIKIYSSAVLNYGSKLSLKDMFKLYKDKNN